MNSPQKNNGKKIWEKAVSLAVITVFILSDISFSTEIKRETLAASFASKPIVIVEPDSHGNPIIGISGNELPIGEKWILREIGLLTSQLMSLNIKSKNTLVDEIKRNLLIRRAKGGLSEAGFGIGEVEELRATSGEREGFSIEVEKEGEVAYRVNFLLTKKEKARYFTTVKVNGGEKDIFILFEDERPEMKEENETSLEENTGKEQKELSSSAVGTFWKIEKYSKNNRHIFQFELKDYIASQGENNEKRERKNIKELLEKGLLIKKNGPGEEEIYQFSESAILVKIHLEFHEEEPSGYKNPEISAHDIVHLSREILPPEEVLETLLHLTGQYLWKAEFTEALNNAKKGEGWQIIDTKGKDTLLKELRPLDKKVFMDSGKMEVRREAYDGHLTEVALEETEDLKKAGRRVNYYAGSGNDIEEEDLKGIHQVLSEHLKVVDLAGRSAGGVHPGEYRLTDNFRNGTAAPNAHMIPEAMREMFSMFGSRQFESMHPVEQAAVAFYLVQNLQPFENGNTRTASLLMNYILMKNNYPPFMLTEENGEKFQKVLRFMRKPEKNRRNEGSLSFSEFINVPQKLIMSSSAVEDLREYAAEFTMFLAQEICEAADQIRYPWGNPTKGTALDVGIYPDGEGGKAEFWYNTAVSVKFPRDILREKMEQIVQMSGSIVGKSEGKVVEWNIKNINIDEYLSALSYAEDIFSSGDVSPETLEKMLVDFNFYMAETINRAYAWDGYVSDVLWKDFSTMVRSIFTEGSSLRVKEDAVGYAAEMFVRAVKMHAFNDGNHRTADMLLNFILVKNGFPYFVLTPENVMEYYELLNTSDLQEGKYDLVKITGFFRREIEKTGQYMALLGEGFGYETAWGPEGALWESERPGTNPQNIHTKREGTPIELSEKMFLDRVGECKREDDLKELLMLEKSRRGNEKVMSAISYVLEKRAGEMAEIFALEPGLRNFRENILLLAHRQVLGEDAVKEVFRNDLAEFAEELSLFKQREEDMRSIARAITVLSSPELFGEEETRKHFVRSPKGFFRALKALKNVGISTFAGISERSPHFLKAIKGLTEKDINKTAVILEKLAEIDSPGLWILERFAALVGEKEFWGIMALFPEEFIKGVEQLTISDDEKRFAFVTTYSFLSRELGRDLMAQAFLNNPSEFVRGLMRVNNITPAQYMKWLDAKKKEALKKAITAGAGSDITVSYENITETEKNIMRSRLISPAHIRYYKMIAEALPEGNKKQRCLYLASGSDLPVAHIVSGEAREMILADKKSFDPTHNFSKEELLALKERYFQRRREQGFITWYWMDNRVGIGQNLMWELEAMGAKIKGEPEFDEQLGANRIDFILPGESDKKHILYFQVDDLGQLSSYPEKFLKYLKENRIDSFILKAAQNLYLPERDPSKEEEGDSEKSRIPREVMDIIAGTRVENFMAIIDENRESIPGKGYLRPYGEKGSRKAVLADKIEKYEREMNIHFGYGRVILMKAEKVDGDSQPEQLLKKTANAEEFAARLDDQLKLIQAKEETRITFIGLTTDWIEECLDGAAQIDDINRLLIVIRKKCRNLGIELISGDAEYVLGRILDEKENNEKARGLVISDERDIEAFGKVLDNGDPGNKGKILLAGIKTGKLKKNEHIRVVYVLKAAVSVLRNNLSGVLAGETQEIRRLMEEHLIRENSDVGLVFVGENRILFDLPEAEGMEEGELRLMYNAQIFA